MREDQEEVEGDGERHAEHARGEDLRPELRVDGLEEQAETLAAETLEGDGTGAVALELWATVAVADDTRVNRLYDRVLQHAHAVWEAAPTLANVAVLAATASFLSQARPQEATDLMSTACRHIASTVLGDVPLTAADAFHVEFDFRHTLAALTRARDDVVHSSSSGPRAHAIPDAPRASRLAAANRAALYPPIEA